MVEVVVAITTAILLAGKLSSNFLIKEFKFIVKSKSKTMQALAMFESKEETLVVTHIQAESRQIICYIHHCSAHLLLCVLSTSCFHKTAHKGTLQWNIRTYAWLPSFLASPVSFKH